MDLYRLENVVTTPHMAGVSQQAIINMAMGCAEKIIQYFFCKDSRKFFKKPLTIDCDGWYRPPVFTDIRFD